MKKLLVAITMVSLLAVSHSLAQGNLVPPAAGTRDLGTSLLPWGNLYANDWYLSANGTLTTGTNVTITIGANSTLTMGAGVTLDLGNIPVASLSNALAAITGSIDATAGTATDTTNTITVQVNDVFGNALAAERTFEFWFTTSTQQSTAATNGIDSFTFIAHGSIDRYVYAGDTVVSYIGTTHTDGTMDFQVVASGTGQTNYFFALSPNGTLTKTAVAW